MSAALIKIEKTIKEGMKLISSMKDEGDKSDVSSGFRDQQKQLLDSLSKLKQTGLTVERMYHGGVNADDKMATNGDAKKMMSDAARDEKAVTDAMLCARAFLVSVRKANKGDVEAA